jgi:Ran GTPase-activating protein (RanGAP) involved in mRNA processing and transport
MSDNEEFIDEDPERFIDRIDRHQYDNDDDDDEEEDGERSQRYGNDDDGVDEDHGAASMTAYYKGLIKQLRTNDPSILHARGRGTYFAISSDLSDPVRVAIAEALTKNTIIQRIKLQLGDYKAESAEAMAKYLAQSKSLLSVDLRGQSLVFLSFLRSVFGIDSTQVLVPATFMTFMEALSQSTSLQELDLASMKIGPANKSFESLLTRTQTLRSLNVDLEGCPPLVEEETTAIASGFSKNTTLQKIKLVDWQEASLAPVLAALQDHPVLEILHVEGFQSLGGIDDLLRGKKSQVKQLTIQSFIRSIGEQLVGFESFMQEMGRNTTIIKMVIVNVPLSRDNVQQFKAMLRRNTVLEDLAISHCALRSMGLAEIASALYRNTNIQGLDVSSNGLDDLASANSMRELLRRNKTITRLFIDSNAFGRNIAAVRCIADGLRSNTTLQVLDLSHCQLGDLGLSILAQCLGHQKRSLVDLNLSNNRITPYGIGALLDNATEALSGVTDLTLGHNPMFDEGATLLANALRLQMLPSLKCLRLHACSIDDDGFATLVSALEQNESLEIFSLGGNTFTTPGLLALAASLPNIKGLRDINFTRMTDDPSAMPALLEGFRKNTSLHEVNIGGFGPGKWSKELSFILYRNKFSRLIQDSDTDDRASLGRWSHALASVVTRPDVLFHVLTSKAGLIRAKPKSGKESKKRKHDDSE